MNDNTENRINIYANIDMKQSGQKMKYMIAKAGYSVKAIQNYLHLSCPQPIYRWFHGQVLPTVDHLFMLSKLLGVHMEELLVGKENEKPCDSTGIQNDSGERIFNTRINDYFVCDRIIFYSLYLKKLNIDTEIHQIGG